MVWVVIQYNLKGDHWNLLNLVVRKFLNEVHVQTKFHANWKGWGFCFVDLEWPYNSMNSWYQMTIIVQWHGIHRQQHTKDSRLLCYRVLRWLKNIFSGIFKRKILWPDISFANSLSNSAVFIKKDLLNFFARIFFSVINHRYE